MIRIKINGRDVEAPAGSTILEAAQQAHVVIPTLCYLKDINKIGACRICVVEVKGAKNLVASCVTPVSPNMEIQTDTPEVFESRRKSLELICAKHRMDCEYCSRYSDCELHGLIRTHGINDKQYGYLHEADLDESAPHLVRDKSKCVQCRRCVSVCRKSQQVGVIGVTGRGSAAKVGPALPLAETTCINCGQCIAVCPTGALAERDDTRQVWMAINNHSKHVVAIVSPFVAGQLGESFLDPVGTNVEGKTISVLRNLGFDRVFDLENATAQAVLEGSSELLERLGKGTEMPMITSHCPSWLKFCASDYPEFSGEISASKGPQEVLGAFCKSQYAEHAGIDPKDIVVVSINPCTAEKIECHRLGTTREGYPNVDVSLTTRELAAMFRRACVSSYTTLKVWRELPDGAYDPLQGMVSEPGHFFSENGGLLKAILGSAHQVLTEGSLPALHFTSVEGNESIQETELVLNGHSVKAAVVSGMANAAELLEMVKSGQKTYAFIEVMACPGGCLNGGGQPRQPGSTHNFTDLKGDRAKALQPS